MQAYPVRWSSSSGSIGKTNGSLHVPPTFLRFGSDTSGDA
jgi:hypothetical protein